jgi:hypothetical protein
VVAFNFLACDRDQELLLPPSLRDGPQEDHLAWFVIDAVEELDLGAFYAGYRGDGWGRAAFDPKMMVARRSSRQIVQVRDGRHAGRARRPLAGHSAAVRVTAATVFRGGTSVRP